MGRGGIFGVLDIKKTGGILGGCGAKIWEIYQSDLFLNFNAGIVVSRGDHFEDFVFFGGSTF